MVRQSPVSLLWITSARIPEVAGGDALADAVVVVAAGQDLELVAVHQCYQLLADVLRPPQGPGLDEVLVAPRVRETVVRPGLVDLQQRAVVPLRLVEPRLLLVGHRLLVLRPVEDVLHREHGNNGHDLVAAPEVHGRQQHLGELRLHGELRHLPPQLRQEALVVQGAQGPEGLHGVDHGLHRRGVHEVEGQHVVDAHGLQQQDHVREVCALDLRDGRGQHLVPVGDLRVEPVALAGASAPSPTRPLPRVGLADGRDQERVHTRLGIVHLDLGHAGVDHEVDAVNRQGRLRDVGRDDALPTARRRGLEDHGLHLGGQRAVHGQDDEGRRAHGLKFLHPLVENLACSVDLLLSRQEHEDIAGWLREVNLQHGHQRGLDVVLLGVLRVEDLNGESSAWDREDVGIEEIAGEFLRIQGR
mmetsp:Transcript_51401/g.159378  ORF Transcript_51401/g.159378 Transcript_51401/m.159378 type:complete len:415 (+) Transcript_51401:305-1549(+)